MADEIKQVLGFDASQAIAELTRLDGVLATFEKRLQTSATQFSTFNKNAGRTVAALIQISTHGNAAAAALANVGNAKAASGNQNSAQNAQAAAQAASQLAIALNQSASSAQTASVRIGNALVRIGNQSTVTSRQVQQNVGRMTTSLNLLSRIVFTQFIVRALSQLRNAFRATAQSAIEFQNQIALISTIDDSAQSFENLSAQVRRSSEEFNVPLLETAAALYQTISNQVGDAAESTEFLNESLRFARATGSSASDAVDLLSGALKSYQLDVSQADRVSSVFFKTVDLGRISASELANSFGRVGPVSAELGLSLEELNGALAAITVRGSKTSEALTQVRAITTALLKPSVAMTKALNDLGFASGQSALKTVGLAGILAALEDSTKGSAAALAALFPNVRGLSGVASLTGDDLKSLTNNIREMENVSDNFANEKFLQATNTDAARLTKEITKLKNAFTIDLGNALLETTANLFDMVGGADNLTAAIGAAGPAILGITGLLAGFRVQAALATTAVAGLGKALGVLGLFAAAGGVGTSIGDAIAKELQEARGARLKALEEINAAELKAFTDAQDKKREPANKADNDRLRETRRILQEFNKIYLQDVENAKSASDALVANTNASLNRILETREKLVDALAKASQEAADIAASSRGRQQGLRDLQGDRDFEFDTKNLRTAEKFAALAERARQLAREASRELSQGGLLGDPEKIQRALQLFEKAQRIGESAQDIAERTNNRFLEADAQSLLGELTRKQIADEQRLTAIQRQRQQALEAERQKQQQITDFIREQTKLALENTGQFDEKGQQFNEEELARRAAARQQALRNIAEQALSQADLDATKALGLVDFVNRFESELARDPIQLAFDVEAATQRIQAQLKQAFADFKIGVNVDTAGLLDVLGREFNTPDQIAEGFEEVNRKAGEARQKIDEAFAAGQQGEGLKQQLQDIIEQLGERGLGSVGALASDSLREGLTSVSSLRSMISELTNNTNISAEQLEALRQKFLSFTQSIQQGAEAFGVNAGELFFQGDVELLDQAFQKLTQLKQLQATSTLDPGLQAQLSKLEAVLAQQPGAQFSQASSAISSATGPSAAIAAAWERAAVAAERTAAAAQRAANARNKNFGGPMHLADGGFASRGQDTIPAMLSPGEFVINSKSSRSFFSQVQAINAGQAPAHRESGGPVTNVGDIHIAVNGGSTSQQTIDEIGRGLKRQIRRGRLDL